MEEVKIKKDGLIDHLTKLHYQFRDAMSEGYRKIDMSDVAKMMDEFVGSNDPKWEINELKTILVITKSLKDRFTLENCPQATDARERFLKQYDEKLKLLNERDI